MRERERTKCLSCRNRARAPASKQDMKYLDEAKCWTNKPFLFWRKSREHFGRKKNIGNVSFASNWLKTIAEHRQRQRQLVTSRTKCLWVVTPHVANSSCLATCPRTNAQQIGMKMTRLNQISNYFRSHDAVISWFLFSATDHMPQMENKWIIRVEFVFWAMQWHRVPNREQRRRRRERIWWMCVAACRSCKGVCMWRWQRWYRRRCRCLSQHLFTNCAPHNVWYNDKIVHTA